MPSNDREIDRRSVLKTGGMALAGLVGASGAASANPGRGQGRRRHGDGQGNGKGGQQGPPEHSAAQEHSPIHAETLEESGGAAVGSVQVPIGGSGGAGAVSAQSASSEPPEFVFIEQPDGSVAIAHPAGKQPGPVNGGGR